MDTIPSPSTHEAPVEKSTEQVDVSLSQLSTGDTLGDGLEQLEAMVTEELQQTPGPHTRRPQNHSTQPQQDLANNRTGVPVPYDHPVAQQTAPMAEDQERAASLPTNHAQVQHAQTS